MRVGALWALSVIRKPGVEKKCGAAPNARGGRKPQRAGDSDVRLGREETFEGDIVAANAHLGAAEETRLWNPRLFCFITGLGWV